jgi:hypothetical protein
MQRTGTGKYVQSIYYMVYFSFLRPQLHVQGKTQEAKSDLARLAKIRADREEAQAKRKAEAEGQPILLICFFSNLWSVYVVAKAAEIEAKKKSAAAGKRI